MTENNHEQGEVHNVVCACERCNSLRGDNQTDHHPYWNDTSNLNSITNYHTKQPPQEQEQQQQPVDESEHVNQVQLPETVPRGTPPIDIKCGPLLRYLGMKDKAVDCWRGTMMIVTKDETSDYSQIPYATLLIGGQPISVQSEKIHAQEGVTFWRFSLDLTMQSDEQAITYWINDDKYNQFTFYIPAIDQTMNTMVHSCNGFSYGVDPDDFRGCLWKDVLKQHEENQHFHVMLGGGDQIYCDSIKEDCELVKKWAHEHNPVKKHAIKFDEHAEASMSTYFLWHYIKWFGSGYWKGAKGATLQPDLPRAMAQIPMVNIFDDHDIIDGFGSYSEHTMKVPVFQGVGNVAFRYYMLFQHQTALHETPSDPSWVVGEHEGPYIKQKSRSVYHRLGKSIGFYGLDCRTERKKNEVVRKDTYQKMFDRLENEIKQSNGDIKHILLMLGVPIAYPRLVWLENLLTSKVMDPVKSLARHGMFGGLLNQFDGSIEILDDLDDHWCAKHHKTERNWLVKQLLEFGKRMHVRITILSGDVHLCGIGRFYSKEHTDPARDGNLIFNVISSAIVNTPPPNKMADFLNKRNKVHHLTKEVDEDMVKIFWTDVDGVKRHNTRLLPRRNWCSIIEQGVGAKGVGKHAGPVWDVINPDNGISSDQESEVLYPDDPSSLSVVLHVERDQEDTDSKTQPYELLVPALNV